MSVHPKTKSAFSDFAEVYLAEDCAGPPITELPQVAALISRAKLEDVLCIGCGGGAECNSLLKKRPRSLVGIDPSEHMIRIAKRDYPLIDFRIGSVDSIDFADGSFDLIYCAHVLHYIRDWTRPLHEMRRVLRADGQFVLTLHHPIDWAYSSRNDGILFTADGKKLSEADYLVPQELHARWYGTELVCYHRPVGHMINEISSCGLRILECVEAGISECPQIPLLVAFRVCQA